MMSRIHGICTDSSICILFSIHIQRLTLFMLIHKYTQTMPTILLLITYINIHIHTHTYHKQLPHPIRHEPKRDPTSSRRDTDHR